MKIAIVTGASSGIGREYVRQLDAKGGLDQIWVIARRAERLEELKTAISTPIVPISIDLARENSDEILRHKLVDEGPDVRVLVNAAGYGKFGAVEDIYPSEQLGMVELNINALMKVPLRYFLICRQEVRYSLFPPALPFTPCPISPHMPQQNPLC